MLAACGRQVNSRTVEFSFICCCLFIPFPCQQQITWIPDPTSLLMFLRSYGTSFIRNFSQKENIIL